MFDLLALGWEHYAFTIPLSLLSVFLMLVILVQRGRGGGLTGALGGMGGQSAFGTKAGDLFTRITVGVVAVWMLLSMAALKILNKTGMTVAAPPPSPAAAPAQGGTTSDIPLTGGAGKGTTAPTTTVPKTTTPPTTPPTTPKTTPGKSAPPATGKATEGGAAAKDATSTKAPE